MNTELYKYQKAGVRRMFQLDGRFLLADDMGLGKTIQSLRYIELNTDIKLSIIVCPASLKWQWQEEITHHLGWTSAVLEGRRPPRHYHRGHSTPPILLINYDILEHWIPVLRQLRPEFIALDECQLIKNLGAARTANVQALFRGVPFAAGLSGTPIENNPAEFFPILNLLYPDRFPDFFPFCVEYCKPRLMPWGKWEYKGAKNLDKLHTEVKDIMIRRTTDQVLKHLPPRTRVIVPIHLSKKAMTEYNRAEKDFLNWLLVVSPKLEKSARKMAALSQVNHLKRLAAELKLPQVMDWIQTYLDSTNKKLITFAIHHKILDALKDKFDRQCVLIDGRVSNKLDSKGTSPRQRLVRKARTLPEIRLLLGQLEAAGKGLNLTEFEGVAKAELGWKPTDHEQAEKRAHRIGQTKPVTSYYLIAKGTIEERVCARLQEKKDVVNQILDGDGGADFDIANQLLTEYEREAKHAEI